ncbi:MAG TPA: substrate-binding domain-containing protein [Streptosporangiaceae bacterium]|nr:substrate-binding domain-containing protein [Streptosporangiaceae bacterium]
MHGRKNGLTSRRRHTWIKLACAVAIAAVAAACSSAPSSSPSANASGASNSSSKCGTTVAVGPSNPTGVYASMSPALKAIYSSFPGQLIQSPWATTKIKAKPPWKIGFIAFAITSPYNYHVLVGLQQQFAVAKKEGLVTGSLMTNIPATMAASTAEEQISAIQQMVREGVNAIILLPVDSVAEASAIDAAGKAGVPVILADTPPAPNTPYAVSAWSQNQVQADAGALGLIQKGNIIMVKGVPGNENDVVLYDQALADLKNCPNIHVAATLYGQWDEGTAKTVVAQYIAAHPQPLAGAIQDGGMMSGIIEAFQAQGTTVPVIADGECYAGDLSWWLAHKSSYKTVAQCFNGFQGSYVYWDVAMRILDNKGPKYNVLEMPSPAITVANLAKFAQPGLALTSNAEVGGPTTAWCDDTCLNKYFNVSGAVSKP